MIKSFRSKPLSDLFETGKSRKVQPKHLKRLRQILGLLDVATVPAQVNAPGLHLHLLDPKKVGRYAVWVDENFRVTFKFEGKDVVEVDYVDYH